MIEELGRYKILAEIGRGGFAIVYRARDTKLNRSVALKELRPGLLDDIEWVKRFNREAQTIARLDHSRIVTIYDVVELEKRLFIVMRLIEGPSLAEVIAGQGALAWSRTVELISAVAEGLDYAHSRDILHRDLKPANILLDPERGPLLSDFGLAKLVGDHSLSQSGGIVGTAHYIAPEVWEGEEATPQADIYALGCILYEMLTGDKLFRGDSPPAVMMAHFNRLTLPETWPEGVPSGQAGVLTTALARQPEDRYSTAQELVEALTTLAEQESRGAGVPGSKVAGEHRHAYRSKRAPPPPRTSAPLHNLPPQPTSFVGRETELVEIASHLADPACRLLTLVGPGGIGKTRLALQAAVAALNAFVDGVYFVPLASLSSAEFLATAIAEALKISFYGSGDPQEQLLNYLRTKEILLVLDNFEHLLTSPVGDMAVRSLPETGLTGGEGLLSDLILTAPQVRLLVTSRERLNLQEEWVVELKGLPYPSLEGEDSKTLEAYSAVQLFLQRARQARSNFMLTTEGIPYVARICRLVDGMPLGLELAAVWVRLMSCREIAREIEQNLDFLATSMRNVPERHRSLRAVFRHSWQLLAEEEQEVFKRLSVFRGGFLREAGEQVAGGSLPLLSTLMDKSLLGRTPAGRYEIHELLRQFAAEELDALPGERDLVRDQHSAYYLNLLQERTEDLKGERQKEAFDEITVDIDNVRLGWHRAIARRNVRALGNCTESLLLFGDYRGWFQEGEAAFRQAVEGLAEGTKEAHTQVSGGEEEHEKGQHWEQCRKSKSQNRNLVLSEAQESKIAMGQLLTGKGWFTVRLGLLGPGLELLQQSVTLLRQAGRASQRDLAFSLYWLAYIYFFQGQYSAAKQHAQESLAIYTEVNDRWGIGNALWVQGVAATYQGAYAEANQLCEESARVLRQVGDRWGLANTFFVLGIVARVRGEYAPAARLLEEGLQIGHDLEVVFGYMLRELGYLAIALGNYTRAQERMQESLLTLKEIGARNAIVFPLDGLGSVARLRGEYHQAEQLHQESLTICQEIGEGRGIALCLFNLGRLAFDRGQYPKAERLHQESLTAFEQIGHQHGIASALCHLGYVASASGSDRYQEAKQRFHQALEIALKIGAAPLALDILIGLATLRTTSESEAAGQERAVELLALVLHHSASEQETKDKARGLLAELGTELPPEVIVAAQERGKARDLWNTAAELLVELNQT